ncbi:MAG: hypothetical protein HY775_04815 [Acidobacteria bacterium]|nr:hypothetical protein [Acidobacteriota bacterium]
MGWFRRRAKVKKEAEFAFQQCPGCGYDFVTGEGGRRCGWYECPYLPEELKVLCPECNYNFATAEGRPRCSDPPTCDWAVEGYAHVQAARKTFDHPEV